MPCPGPTPALLHAAPSNPPTLTPCHSPDTFPFPSSRHIGWKVVQRASQQWLKRGQQGAGSTQAEPV